MSGQKTTEEIDCFRIGDPNGAFPIFDATGSRIAPGRWNSPSNPMIYTSRRYSTALLEKLVYSSGVLPPNQHYVTVTIPVGTSYEYFDVHDPANRGWDDPLPALSRAYGDAWAVANRSLLMIVPSVIARIDENILINPRHPDFPLLRQAPFNKPVYWDRRLFGSSRTPP